MKKELIQINDVIDQLNSLVSSSNDEIENSNDYAQKLYFSGYVKGLEMSLFIIKSFFQKNILVNDIKQRKLKIDVIGPVEADLVKCQLDIDGRVCTIYIPRSNYEALVYDRVFLLKGKVSDPSGVINTTNVFIEED